MATVLLKQVIARTCQLRHGASLLSISFINSALLDLVDFCPGTFGSFTVFRFRIIPFLRVSACFDGSQL